MVDSISLLFVVYLFLFFVCFAYLSIILGTTTEDLTEISLIILYTKQCFLHVACSTYSSPWDLDFFLSIPQSCREYEGSFVVGKG